MKRRLFNLASVVSLLLFISTLALWVRSYHRFDIIRWWNGSLTFGFGGNSGRFGMNLWAERDPGAASGPEPGVSTESDIEHGPRYEWHFLLNHGHYGSHGSIEQWDVDAPHWTVAVASLLLPTARLLFALRKPYPEGRCLVCGYDLRASTDRCSECGTPIPAGAKT